jgi:hypothetical protein
MVAGTRENAPPPLTINGFITFRSRLSTFYAMHQFSGYFSLNQFYGISSAQASQWCVSPMRGLPAIHGRNVWRAFATSEGRSGRGVETTAVAANTAARTYLTGNGHDG